MEATIVWKGGEGFPGYAPQSLGTVPMPVGGVVVDRRSHASPPSPKQSKMINGPPDALCDFNVVSELSCDAPKISSS